MAKQGSIIGVGLVRARRRWPSRDDDLLQCTDAIQALAAVHLVGMCPASAAQYSSTLPAGASWAPRPPAAALYGSTVTIVTSKGHAPVVVPTVTGAGSTYASASATLTAAGFVPAQAKRTARPFPPARSSGPPRRLGRTPPFGSTVTVAVSLAPNR